MKPIQIGLLIAAGAIGGALLTKVVLRHHPAAPVAAHAPAPVATSAPAATPATAAAAEPVATQHPSPFAAPRKAAAPARSYTKSAAPARRDPVVVAVEQAQPAAVPPPAASPVPEPVAPAPEPTPQPIPPARPDPEYATPAPPAPPEPHQVTLNAGTLIPVRLVDGLTTERNMPGDPFTATLDKELVVDGFVIAERGARVEGRVAASDRGGRVSGVASLAVELKRIRLSDGQWVTLPTDPFERRAAPGHRDDATKIGAGLAIGTVIGAIAGGGKGAAIGAGAGTAAGAGAVLATRGAAATLPSETRLSFRLRAPVTVTERR